jgi:hypothetical protein
MGLPVITTNWGGSTEFVTPTSGLLINVTELIETSGGEEATQSQPSDGGR